MTRSIILLAAVFFPYHLQAFALSPSEVIPAEPVKRNVYLSDSLVSGGDALANPVNLNGVRWAKNPAGYERLVIDLSGEGTGWETKTPPYFQVGHDGRASSIDGGTKPANCSFSVAISLPCFALRVEIGTRLPSLVSLVNIQGESRTSRTTTVCL